MEKYKYIKISIFIIDIFFVALAILAFSLPFLVNWYVEIMNRNSSLAATVMLTSYPCVPFVFMALLSLRRFLKGVMKDEMFSPYNLKQLKILGFSSIIIALITLVAGAFYMPFYFVGLTFGFMSLLVFSLLSVGKSQEEKENDEEIQETNEEE